MNHQTVKTPESAVTSLARPNGSLVPPRPSAHVPLGPALPRPTAEGLGSASPDPQGMRTSSLNPRGLGSAPFNGRGTTLLRPTGKN